MPTIDLNALRQPARAGGIRLPHRPAMTTMTRSRSTAEGVPTGVNAAGAGGGRPGSGGAGTLRSAAERARPGHVPPRW
ncbi:2,4-dienoyl-CoA reductase-like NADH-dependent reductase (Old Yellow Enzyme family) [Streptomyces aurantiacus]|nr:2,4-dienoyl-CoA reductase-like NADH-dependent reductase (Old Yellow Enzyme family) [Streptomyces aurantiacus]